METLDMTWCTFCGSNLNHRLRVWNIITNTSYSICSGEWGRTDANFSTGTLAYARGLLILNDTLYVGTDQMIRSKVSKV